MFWKVGISLRNIDNAIFCNYVIAFQCEFEGSLHCKWSSWAGKVWASSVGKSLFYFERLWYYSGKEYFISATFTFKHYIQDFMILLSFVAQIFLSLNPNFLYKPTGKTVDIERKSWKIRNFMFSLVFYLLSTNLFSWFKVIFSSFMIILFLACFH